MNVIETSDLGKRSGKSWALRDCSLSVPAGHLAALVGPNGAGESTLMNMTAGLTVPTSGTATVLGGHPAGSAAALNGVAFVAQDAPVYATPPKSPAPDEPPTPSTRLCAHLSISSDHTVHLLIDFDHENRTIRAQKWSESIGR